MSDAQQCAELRYPSVRVCGAAAQHSRHRAAAARFALGTPAGASPKIAWAWPRLKLSASSVDCFRLIVLARAHHAARRWRVCGTCVDRDEAREGSQPAAVAWRSQPRAFTCGVSLRSTSRRIRRAPTTSRHADEWSLMVPAVLPCASKPPACCRRLSRRVRNSTRRKSRVNEAAAAALLAETPHARRQQ